MINPYTQAATQPRLDLYDPYPFQEAKDLIQTKDRQYSDYLNKLDAYSNTIANIEAVSEPDKQYVSELTNNINSKINDAVSKGIDFSDPIQARRFSKDMQSTVDMNRLKSISGTTAAYKAYRDQIEKLGKSYDPIMDDYSTDNQGNPIHVSQWDSSKGSWYGKAGAAVDYDVAFDKYFKGFSKGRHLGETGDGHWMEGRTGADVQGAVVGSVDSLMADTDVSRIVDRYIRVAQRNNPDALIKGYDNSGKPIFKSRADIATEEATNYGMTRTWNEKKGSYDPMRTFLARQAFKEANGPVNWRNDTLSDIQYNEEQTKLNLGVTKKETQKDGTVRIVPVREPTKEEQKQIYDSRFSTADPDILKYEMPQVKTESGKLGTSGDKDVNSNKIVFNANDPQNSKLDRLVSKFVDPTQVKENAKLEKIQEELAKFDSANDILSKQKETRESKGINQRIPGTMLDVRMRAPETATDEEKTSAEIQRELALTNLAKLGAAHVVPDPKTGHAQIIPDQTKLAKLRNIQKYNTTINSIQNTTLPVYISTGSNNKVVVASDVVNGVPSEQIYMGAGAYVYEKDIKSRNKTFSKGEITISPEQFKEYMGAKEMKTTDGETIYIWDTNYRVGDSPMEQRGQNKAYSDKFETKNKAVITDDGYEQE